MGSSAFLLPLEARGLYREMLTQAWRRGARLPNDHEAIKRAIGATDEEWDRNWPLISGYFRAKNGQLFNRTQVQIYQQTRRLQGARSDAGRRGGLKTQALKRQAKPQANKQATQEATAQTKLNPPSPSPSPISTNGVVQVPALVSTRGVVQTTVPPAASNVRSKTPSFTGQRLVVFDWMVADLRRLLGKHFNGFDVYSWFFTLDTAAEREDILIPQRDGGEWLQARTIEEALRRGLKMATATTRPDPLNRSMFAPGTSTEELTVALKGALTEKRR